MYFGKVFLVAILWLSYSMSPMKSKKNRMTRGMSAQAGFTLIEILVVIGIIAILAAVVLIAINPARQFKQAHDSQRVSNVNAILNAIGQNIAENKGVFTCAVGALPASSTVMKAGAGFYDIRSCIVPTYMAEVPVDPTAGHAWDGSTYDTGYMVSASSTTGRITVAAVGEVT